MPPDDELTPVVPALEPAELLGPQSSQIASEGRLRLIPGAQIQQIDRKLPPIEEESAEAGDLFGQPGEFGVHPEGDFPPRLAGQDLPVAIGHLDRIRRRREGTETDLDGYLA